MTEARIREIAEQHYDSACLVGEIRVAAIVKAITLALAEREKEIVAEITSRKAIVVALMAKLPTLDLEWSQETQQAWWESFDRLLAKISWIESGEAKKT